jgi:copper homeostasis protein
MSGPNTHTPSSSRAIRIEACIASLSDAVAAAEGGADRLELNQAIELGGLTPPVALLQQIKAAVDLPVVCMVRPRGGGFHYQSHELMVMRTSAKQLLEAGADGIVSGVLDSAGGLHATFWRDLKAMVGKRELVFHRALDTSETTSTLFEQLISLGTTRVLTSGGEPTAWEGMERLQQWQATYGDRIEILPGSGIRPDNARELLQATGCQQLHGTFSSLRSDFATPVGPSEYPATSRDIVAAVRAAVDAS